MTVRADPDEHRRRLVRRIGRQTRWLAAGLEGAGAAGFLGVLFGDQIQRPTYAAHLASTFFCVGLIAFLLWPMVRKHERFSAVRAVFYGILVALLGNYLWYWSLALIEAPHWLSNPALPLTIFANSLALVAAGVVAFGWVTFPIGIGIAWLVGAWGNRRLGSLQHVVSAVHLAARPQPGA